MQQWPCCAPPIWNESRTLVDITPSFLFFFLRELQLLGNCNGTSPNENKNCRMGEALRSLRSLRLFLLDRKRQQLLHARTYRNTAELCGSVDAPENGIPRRGLEQRMG